MNNLKNVLLMDNATERYFRKISRRKVNILSGLPVCGETENIRGAREGGSVINGPTN